MSRFCSPLRYPGGKNCVFPFISDLFIKNDFIGHSYAEPYAGGAGLALRLLYEEYIPKAYINDFDPCISAFWRIATEQSNQLIDWIEDTSVDLGVWRKSKDIVKNYKNHSLLEVATATFFLNRTNISGVIKGGAIGGLDQTGKYKIDVRFNKKDLIPRFEKIAKFKDRIIVSNLDGVKFIQNLNRKKENIFIYLDPPYVEKGYQLYLNSYSENDHIKLSKYITKLNKDWIMSYDNNQFIVDTYSDYRKISYSLSQSTSNRVGKEIFIFDNEIKYASSMKKLKSPICI